MGRFENENQIREMPTESPKEGMQQRLAVFTNFLKRGELIEADLFTQVATQTFR
jgi:hypothetical protein